MMPQGYLSRTFALPQAPFWHERSPPSVNPSNLAQICQRTDTSIKVLIHDGIGMLLSAKQLRRRRFAWPAHQWSFNR
jgi:hypothetical protein